MGTQAASSRPVETQSPEQAAFRRARKRMVIRAEAVSFEFDGARMLEAVRVALEAEDEQTTITIERTRIER